MSSNNTYTEQKYCVYIIHYSGDVLPPKNNSSITPSNYIGSTSVDKIHNGYKGSVQSKKYKSIWHSELKNNQHLFSVEIISYHDTRPEATHKELQLQRIFNAVTNPLFVNMSYAQANGCFGMEQSTENKIETTNRNKQLMSQGKHSSQILASTGKHPSQIMSRNGTHPFQKEEFKTETSKRNSKLNKEKSLRPIYIETKQLCYEAREKFNFKVPFGLNIRTNEYLESLNAELKELLNI